jgi:hypothetical protein
MIQTLRITWYFYKSVLVWCVLVTAACIFFVFSGQLNVALACICKLAAYAAVLGMQYLNANATRNYFYFRNAGYSINSLYLYAFGLDFIAFVILLSLSTIR